MEPAFNAISKFNMPASPEQLEWLLEQVRSQVTSDKFQLQIASSLLFCLSRLNVPSDHAAWAALLTLVGDAVATKPESLTPMDLTKTFWALRNSKVKSAVELEHALGAEVLSRSTEFDAEAVSMMLWVLMLNPHSNPLGLVQAMCEQTVVKCGAFKPQESAQALFSLSNILPAIDGAAVQAVCAVAVAKSKFFKHQEITTILSAFRRWRQPPPPELCTALFDQLATRISFLRPGEISEIMRTFATLKISPNHPSFALLQHAALTKSDRFNPREAAGVLWGVGSVSRVDPELAAAMGRAATKHSHILTASTISDVIYGIGKSDGNFDADMMQMLLVPTLAFICQRFLLHACTVAMTLVTRVRCTGAG
jgi:hypothetical protein